MQFRSLLRQASSQTTFSGLGAELPTDHSHNRSNFGQADLLSTCLDQSSVKSDRRRASVTGMCGVVWCGRVGYGMALYGTAWKCVVQHGKVQYGMALYGILLCIIRIAL